MFIFLFNSKKVEVYTRVAFTKANIGGLSKRTSPQHCPSQNIAWG